MFVALMAQLFLGYAMDRFDDLLEGPVDRWLGGEEDNLLIVHAGLGAVILIMAIVRVIYRQVAGLPPWAATLSAAERRFAHNTEMTLYVLMFLIPLTGIALVLVSGESWELLGQEWETPLDVVDDDILLAAHIATHVAFLAALAAHVGLVLKHQFIKRDGLLRRML